eukprot:s445_g8.t1
MSARTPLEEVNACLQHMQQMDVDPGLGKREVEQAPKDPINKDGPQPKHPPPQSKGQGGQGKGGRSGGPLLAAAAAFGDRKSQPDPVAAGTGHQRQQRQQGWKSNQGQRRGWSSYHWQGSQQRRQQQQQDSVEENLKIMARLCLRHEDELSQMRVERDFVLTMETQEAAVLAKLFNLAMVWKEKKEKQEVDCSLRLCLFLGLQVWLDRMRALEMPSAEAVALRTRIIEQGYAQMPEGTTELQWFYMRWNPTSQAMEKVVDTEPMLQSQVVATLVQIQATTVAPNVLQRFHSTRRMAATYEGETVTFLMSVGLRDPMSAQAWGMLTNLYGSGSGKVIGLKMRPAKMDRQPIAKVLAERYPPPPQRPNRGQRAGEDSANQEGAQKEDELL